MELRLMLIVVSTSLLAFPLLVYIAPRSIKRYFLRNMMMRAIDAPQPPPTSYADHVLPHSPLVRLANNLWLVQGTLPQPGIKFTRAMTIYRVTSTGELVIHSPVCVDEHVAAEIDALGAISYIIAPNAYHRLDVWQWADRYPNAKVICPSFVRVAVEKIVVVNAACEDVFVEFGGDHGAAQLAGISYTSMRCGGDKMELGYVVSLEGDAGGGAAFICTDTFFNLDPIKSDFVTRWIGSANGFGVTTIGMLLTEDIAALKTWIVRDLLPMNLSCIVVGHGDPVCGRQRVITALNTAADRLKL